MADLRREIPAVDRLLGSPSFAPLLAASPRTLVHAALMRVQQRLRERIGNGVPAPDGFKDPEWYARETEAELASLRRPSLRPVINATGVVLHTNLGRAPLADAAIDAIIRTARGYSTLEYDIERGARGSRYDHCAGLLCRLTGAEAALVVNNNAAALVLALNTLAQGRDAVISRGELVEIGGSFRIPDIMSRSGARMVEVGATNRTHLADYERALGPGTALILKVHPSNFRMRGYTSDVSVPELAHLAVQHGVAVLEDLGSGLLIPAEALGIPPERTARQSLEEGATVVTMSGDKLLGGPQAGIILGKAEAIEAMRRNPLCRALRVDKLTLAALEATLSLYAEERALELPALRMLAAPIEERERRARAFADALRGRGVQADVIPGDSAAGGGALPEAPLPGWQVHIEGDATRIEERLRLGEPPVVARIADGRVLIDLRTVLPDEENVLLEAVIAAAGT